MNDNIHLYAGAYALNALPLGERALFERHLASCEMCQQEVAEYSETAARLSDAVAVIPPVHLREQVLHAAGSIRQAPPAEGLGGRWQDRLRPVLAPVAAGLAAAVLALGGFSTYLYGENQDFRSELADAGEDAQLIEMIATASTVQLDAPDGVSAGFVHSQEEDRGMLLVRGLAELDPTQGYQLWLFHDGAPVPAGVFSPGGDELIRFPAQAQVTGAELVAVTVEPAGGVAAPTGSVVIGAEL